MGLFNFVKEAGEKLWDNLTDHKGQSDKITEHLKKLNIPGADKVQVNVTDGKASVTGDGLTQEQKEKIQVAVGNIAGCSAAAMSGVQSGASGAEQRNVASVPCHAPPP